MNPIPLEILDALHGIPRRILLLLTRGSGWSYIGAHQKIERKRGIGIYDEPEILIPDDGFLAEDSWVHCRSIPRYHNLLYLSSDVLFVYRAASDYFKSLNHPISDCLEDDDKLVVDFSDGDRAEIWGETELIRAYRLFAHAYHHGLILNMPAIKDLDSAIDFNLSYRGEASVVFNFLPVEIEKGKYSDYFRPVAPVDPFEGGYCVGQIQLVEGIFWVVLRRLQPKGKRISVRDKAEHIKGIIYRY